MTTIYYGFNFDTGEKMKGPLQIMNNYKTAVVKTGEKMVFKNTSTDSGLETIYHLRSKDRAFWVKIDNSTGNCLEVEAFQFSVLEIEAMRQEIQAYELFEDINKAGSSLFT